MSDLQDEEREALQPTEAEVEAAARSYWRDIDGMTPGTMPWDHLPEAARIEQSEHSRSALVAALAAREEPHVKGAILQIGTVVEGRPEGWVFDGAHIGHLILPDGSQVCGGWTVSELELIGAAREDTERPDDYWNLCCECGYITIADSWLALNFNEAHEDETTPYEPRLIPAESDPSVYRCPACGHDHEDNDSGAGVFDGTRENVIAERTRLIDDGWEFDPVVRNTEQEHDEA